MITFSTEEIDIDCEILYHAITFNFLAFIIDNIFTFNLGDKVG